MEIPTWSETDFVGMRFRSLSWAYRWTLCSKSFQWLSCRSSTWLQSSVKQEQSKFLKILGLKSSTFAKKLHSWCSSLSLQFSLFFKTRNSKTLSLTVCFRPSSSILSTSRSQPRFFQWSGEYSRRSLSSSKSETKTRKMSSWRGSKNLWSHSKNI